MKESRHRYRHIFPTQYHDENDLKKIIIDHGNMVFRCGWPDFLCRSPQGWFFAVEYKSNGDKIRKNQLLMHAALRLAGIDVFLVKESDVDWENGKWGPYASQSRRKLSTKQLMKKHSELYYEILQKQGGNTKIMHDG